MAVESFGDVDYEFYSYDAPQQFNGKFPLDWKAPGKKYKGKTYREVMQTREGRQYLQWWRDQPAYEFKDATPEQKEYNTDFKKKHVANIDACFKVYDQFLAMEANIRGKKRKSSQRDDASPDVPVVSPNVDVKKDELEVQLETIKEPKETKEPDSPVEKKSRQTQRRMK